MGKEHEIPSRIIACPFELAQPRSVLRFVLRRYLFHPPQEAYPRPPVADQSSTGALSWFLVHELDVHGTTARTSLQNCSTRAQRGTIRGVVSLGFRVGGELLKFTAAS